MLDIFKRLAGRITRFVDNKVQLAKLDIIEHTAGAMSYFILMIAGMFLVLAVLLFAGMGASAFFADVTGSEVAGYFITAGIYILLIVLVVLLKKPILRYFASIYISIFTEDETDED